MESKTGLFDRIISFFRWRLHLGWFVLAGSKGEVSVGLHIKAKRWPVDKGPPYQTIEAPRSPVKTGPPLRSDKNTPPVP